MHRSLDATTTLPDGTHVRVRLPQAADRAALRALHARLRLAAEELELARVLRFDPRERAVVCATAWLDGGPQVVGYAAIDRDAAEPDVLVADEDLAPGIGAVLAQALRRRPAGRRAA
jgi:hypothetical protein